VGVLKALEEAGVRPDCIAGTSMGALIGALYASGHSAERIEALVGSPDWQRLQSGRPERALVPLARRDGQRPVVRVGFDFWRLRLPAAAEPDYRLRRLLFSLLGAPALDAGRDFDRLPIPFRAVAADLATGERVVLESGSLEAAVRASVAAPGALEPVLLGGRWLVDGGITDNMPVDVAREMGADVVVAVDVRSPPVELKPEGDVRHVAAQLFDVLMRHRNDAYAREADLLVRPALDGLANTAYGQHERAVREGLLAARQGMDAIRRLTGTSGEPPAPHAGSNGGPPPAPPRVAAVSVEGTSRVKESLVRTVFALESGGPFDLDRALRGLDAVWATRLFRSLWLDVVPLGEDVKVVVHVREEERRTIALGLSFDETDKAAATVSVRHGNLFGRGETAEMQAQASEARSTLRLSLAVDGIFGAPLGCFVQGLASEWRPRPFQDGQALARIEFDRVGVAGGAQTHLGPSRLLRVGFERAHVAIGAPALGERGSTEVATLGARLAWDTLDEPAWPRHGVAVSLAYDRSLTSLGATHRYWRARAEGLLARRLGRAGTLQLQAFGFTSGGALPLHEQPQIGGPGLVPGLDRDALWGPHAAAAGLTHLLRLKGRLHLVTRVGAGNAWTTREAATFASLHRGVALGFQHPSPVGPLTVEWGRANGRGRVFVTLGYR
jgi:NTE family protein